MNKGGWRPTLSGCLGSRALQYSNNLFKPSKTGLGKDFHLLDVSSAPTGKHLKQILSILQLL
jgi:hypothetical protein